MSSISMSNSTLNAVDQPTKVTKTFGYFDLTVNDLHPPQEDEEEG
jgi:hypothetical protein